MSKPAVWNFDEWIGDTVEQVFQIFQRIPVPGSPGQYTQGPSIDLGGAGVTLAAQIRASKTAGVMATFTATVTADTDTNGRRSFLKLLLPVSQSAILQPGNLVWDVQATWPAVGAAEPVVKTLMAGTFVASSDVTRLS